MRNANQRLELHCDAAKRQSQASRREGRGMRRFRACPVDNLRGQLHVCIVLQATSAELECLARAMAQAAVVFAV